jgi:hypothetical protein
MNYSKLILFFVAGAMIYSCSSDNKTGNGSKSEGGTEQKEEAHVPVEKSYLLAADQSTIAWTRTLDQKSMKRTMKIFGADVDVQMDAVKLNMEGNATPTTGEVVTIDDLYTNGNVLFDMSTFKFSAEKGKGLFDTKEYPTSTLTFLSLEEKDSGSYSAKCELTIQDHTEAIDIPVSITLKGKDLSLKGAFSFNTLLFPLRAKDQVAEINKDIISVQLDLTYLLDQE